jgi:hypothetical protein
MRGGRGGGGGGGGGEVSEGIPKRENILDGMRRIFTTTNALSAYK